MLGEAFAKRMAAIGGFEARPHLAVGVSGGCDSLALLALAQEWATARGGRVSAVTVDHGLRAEAAEEAAQVGRLAAMWGGDHHRLTLGRKLETANVMAAARAARYRIMEEWCRDRAILHLLLGHQRDDQAETLLLRLARGSGLRGLAAMRPVEYRCHLRLLRPLLDIARADLERYCQAHGWPAIDDPSNRNLAYARSRLRQALPILAAEGMTAPRLSMTARHLAQAAELVDGVVAMALARHSRWHPAGFARLALDGWRDEATETRLRALAQLLQWVGGGAYPPRFKRLQRLAERLTLAEGRATLAGCQLTWRRGWLWIGREAASMALAQSVAPGESILWDGRFAIDMPANGPVGWNIGPLGGARPWRTALETAIPRWLWPTLPAWRHLDVVAAVPHLNYSLMDDETKGAGLPLLIYRPAIRLNDGFAVGAECF